MPANKSKTAKSRGLLYKLQNQKKYQLIAFMLVFGVIGSYFVFKSFANPAYYATVAPCKISGKAYPKGTVQLAFYDPSMPGAGGGTSIPTDEAGYFYYNEHRTLTGQEKVIHAKVYASADASYGEEDVIGTGIYAPCPDLKQQPTQPVKGAL